MEPMGTSKAFMIEWAGTACPQRYVLPNSFPESPIPLI